MFAWYAVQGGQSDQTPKSSFLKVVCSVDKWTDEKIINHGEASHVRIKIHNAPLKWSEFFPGLFGHCCVLSASSRHGVHTRVLFVVWWSPDANVRKMFQKASLDEKRNGEGNQSIDRSIKSMKQPDCYKQTTNQSINKKPAIMRHTFTNRNMSDQPFQTSFVERNSNFRTTYKNIHQN